MGDEEQDIPVSKMKLEQQPPRRRRVKKVQYPRRALSIIIPGRQIIFVTADKTTCLECPCFPKEDPYRKPKKLSPCQKSPLTLYELAAKVIDNMDFPGAFGWTEEDVADWMARDVGFPEYRACILNNHIDGMRLLMLEDPSKLPEINIHYFSNIQMITRQVRHLYGTDFVRFARSVGLVPRYPLTSCTWFKSRTGPSWGIRKNWTRTDILRWMKIIMPEPFTMDHWDLVWYMKPDFPKVMFARVPTESNDYIIPSYTSKIEKCTEYMIPRKFRLHPELPDENHMIWMQQRREPGSFQSEMERKRKKLTVPKDTRLMPKKINLAGLRGKDLILARRLMAKPKFLAF